MLLRIFVIACLIVGAFSSIIQRKQRIVAKGRLLCGEKPAADVQVKLVDYDTGPNPDDVMDNKKTNANGEFLLDGIEEELSNIDPFIKIYHDCNDGLPCQRYWKMKVPENYINPADSASKVFDMGTWNLEVIMDGEGRDCIH